MGLAAGAFLWPGKSPGPRLRFPSQPRERIAIASYPFRDVIAGPDDPGGASGSKMDLKDFAAHVVSKFGVNKIEPWSRHFRSVDASYLAEFRASVERARASIANIAVDGDHSPYAADPAERERAVRFGMQWVDVAAALGSPSVRTNIPPAADSQPNLDRAAESLRRVAAYGAQKNVVINLENDNPVSEDPFTLAELIDRVKSPWLHALPDFGNTLVTADATHAYRGIDAMFGRAYNICHVKAAEGGEDGKIVRVDMAKTFGFMKRHGYRGYCSMECDTPGDPYRGTADLVEQTIRYLS